LLPGSPGYEIGWMFCSLAGEGKSSLLLFAQSHPLQPKPASTEHIPPAGKI